MTPICKNIKGVIYKTTNILNGMWYIGKDENDDPAYLGSGVYLSRAIAKYGKNNFVKEILDRAQTSSELALLESKYIEQYNATTDSMSYNIEKGGYDENTATGMNEIDKLQFSVKISESWNNLTVEAKQERISHMDNLVKNKPKTQEHKDKISKSKAGVKQSPETIEKKRLISKKLYDSGVISPPRNDWTGKTHTESSKLKMSIAKKGVKNKKTRLFSASEQEEIQLLYKSGIKTSVIAKMFSTTGPTILRYVKEII